MTRISRINLCSILLSIISKSKPRLARASSLQEILRAFQVQTLGWWNGRHVRLRGVCRKACGFKSRPEHQTARSTCSFARQLFDLAFIAYGFCSLFQEITSHRGKERFASQIPQVHKEPSDSIFTISEVGH